MNKNSSNLRCMLPVVMLWSISPLRLLADDPQNEFRDTIQPILTGKCLTCHSADKKKGKLDLSRRAPAIAGGESGKSIEPGKPEESILFQKISAGEMPPRNPLSAEQVEAFKKWIAAGAPYEGEPLIATVKRAGPGWWSLQKIRRPLVPRTNNPHWIRTPIDAFILARLEAQGLTPAPEADRTTLIRRAYFDLLGLPPALEAVDRFVHDTDPKAYEKLIDELLASQHYGERWARHWLDIVRFAESHGYEMNTLRPNAWPYRDYVIRAFNNDTPYPQFILEQLAGDILKNADWLTQSATGFLVGGAHDMVGNQTPDGMLQQRMDDLDDIISATSATFLGLTVNCCRCHDHKFDPLTQRDYYGMQAILAGVQHADREMPLLDTPERRREIAGLLAELSRIDGRLDDLEPLCQPTVSKPARLPVNSRRNVERFAPVDARFVRFTISATNTGIEPCIDELEIYTAGPAPRNVALAATGAKATASSVYPNNPIHRLEHLTDGQYGNSRSWISNEIGKGWVQIEFPEVMKIDRIIWGRDREEKFKDRLATNYRIEVALEPGKWQLVASSADRLPITDGSLPASRAELSLNSQRERVALLASRTRIQEKLASLQSKLQVYAGTFSQPGQTHVLLRGDPMQKGEPASPGALAIVQPPFAIDAKASESERRRALARWLGHPDNPLPARVLVNRVWHYHFGQGIVNTPSDFGYNGDRPSHPELLDWLASEFVTNGWHLKPLHRMIMLS